MTLRHRVIAVALAALAIIAVLGAQLVLRYADTQRSLSEVVDTIAPASTAVADLNEDINNMERRLRIYVSSESTGMGLLYSAAVVSAEANLDDLSTLLEGRNPETRLVTDVESGLATWLATVGDPVTSAMAADSQQVAQEILDSPQSQSAYVQLTADTFRLSTLLTGKQKAALDDLAAAATRLAWTLGTALAVLLLLPLATYVAVRRHVLKPIAALREQLRESATPGHHDAVIVPTGPPELRDLGAEAEALRRALVHEIDEATAAREALEQEGPVVEAIRRELAARTQDAPLGVTIAGVLRPAEGVLAGDFWDRIPLTDGRAAAVICDVSGHGPRAGIVAMRLKTSITLGLVAGQDPPQILHRACDAFADEPGRFATAVIMIADASTGEVQWVNAGHPAPRLIRADSTIVRLGPTGPMVSWLGGTWTMGSAALAPSDVLLAFTDGILESRDMAGEELGDDDLDTHLRTAAEQARDPAEVIAQVLATVRERADDLGRDDVTLVALRLDPQPTPRIPEPRR
ncbi:MAG TPA: PP2C family protein-serine/threonine phosphatase [Motilibacterales bacterium]|nr:PP2C family protein-serine/threonine phosphatase [Motilibacterales bacterium]